MAGNGAAIAAQVTENIVSRFSVQDDYSEQALQLASTALGVGRALAGFEAAFAVAQRAMGMLRGPMQEAIALNTRYQQSITDIGGTLNSLNIVGHTAQQLSRLTGEALTTAMAGDMAAARQQANALVNDMQRAAAALPGETQDYIQTFTSSLPAFLQATSATTEQIMTITNRATAAGITKNINAMQIGMDMMRIMSGQAQLDVRTWTEVIRPMAINPRTHRAIQSGQEFNALTGVQKLAVVSAALERYMPLIGAFADTWATQTGTFESGVNQLKRVIGAPIFALATESLRELNNAMASVQPYVERLGAAMTTWVTGAVRPIVTYFKEFFDTMADIEGVMARFNAFIGASAFQPLIGAIQRIADVLTNITHFGGLFGGETGSNPIGAASGSTDTAGLLGALLGPNAAAFLIVLSQGANLSHVLEALTTVVSAVVNSLSGVLDAYASQASALISSGAALEAVHWLERGLYSIAEVIPMAAQAFVNVMETVWSAISSFFSTFMDVMGPILSIFGFMTGNMAGLSSAVALITQVIQASIWIFESLAVVALGILAPFILLGAVVLGFIRLLYNGIQVIKGWLGMEQGGIELNLPESTQSANPPWLESLRALMTHEDPVQQRLRENPRARQPVHHNHQDFRYSRFDITQKFAEGFDPDRIAAVFAHDLEAMAEQRLDSGIVPGFSG